MRPSKSCSSTWKCRANQSRPKKLDTPFHKYGHSVAPHSSTRHLVEQAASRLLTRLLLEDSNATASSSELLTFEKLCLSRSACLTVYQSTLCRTKYLSPFHRGSTHVYGLRRKVGLHRIGLCRHGGFVAVCSPCLERAGQRAPGFPSAKMC